jgi:hypothetical protein
VGGGPVEPLVLRPDGRADRGDPAPGSLAPNMNQTATQTRNTP